MSSSAFLEEIVSWDDEKRIEQLAEVLPRLILCLENYRSHDEAVGVLQILCHSFVPIVEKEQLEKEVFSRISQQVCGLLDAVFEELHERVNQDQETDCGHLIALLQHVASILQCVEQCAKHATSMTEIRPSQVHSLMVCSFHVLKGSYSHCQESSSLYGDTLPSLSDSLSLVFKSAHSLQMVLLNLLDRLVSPGDHSKQDVQDIAQVCAELFALCHVVSCLDLKLTISLWKALSRLVGPQAEVLHPYIDLCGMVSYLCEEISTGTTQLLQSAPPACVEDEVILSQRDEKAFQKSLRILSLQMKVLVALTRDFHNFLTDCVPAVYRLMLYLISVLPPSLCAPSLQKKHEGELRRQLCDAAEPLMSHLLTNAAFARCVLVPQDTVEKMSFPSLLLQLMVMEAVAQASGDITAQWLDISMAAADSVPPRPNLLSAVLSSLDTCHVEVCLPVSMLGAHCDGRPQRTLSLYQCVVEKLCAFIASCPAVLFHNVEKSLLEALLGSNPISSQAAADCWCFLSRYGTADLCWLHTQRLLSLVLHIHRRASGLCSSYSSSSGSSNSSGNSNSYNRSLRPLTSLLGRLVKFLTPQHQMEFKSMLPPDRHIGVWAELGVAALCGDVCSEVCRSLTAASLTVLCAFCHSSCPTLAQAASAIPALKCLHTILGNPDTANHVTPQQGAELIGLMSAMWSLIGVKHCRSGLEHDDVRLDYLSALVGLTADIVEQLEGQLLLQVLVILHQLLKESRSRDFSITVLHFMQSLGQLRIAPSVEQGQILRKIGDIFALGLTHKAACVQYMALESFARFAEQTAHEAVVPDCLAQHSDLQDKVAAFLQKEPFPEGYQFDAVIYLQNQHQQFRKRVHTEDIRGFSLSVGAEAVRPHCKRLRTDDTEHMDQSDDFQGMLNDLDLLTQRIEKLRMNRKLPDWVVTCGKPLLQRLSSCFDCH